MPPAPMGGTWHLEAIEAPEVPANQKKAYAGHKAAKQRKLAHCKGSKVDHAELAAQKEPQTQLQRLQVLPLLLLLLLLPVLPPLS